jgi:hypothetical protein
MIKLHSITSIITNSSTVIYTHSGASEQAAKDMINEILKTLNVNKSFDDFFTTVVLFERYSYYSEWLRYNKVEGVDENTEILTLYKDVMDGRMPKPTWFAEAESKLKDDETGYDYPTTLYIIPKLPEYKNMAKLIKNFLYSTSQEAFRDG